MRQGYVKGLIIGAILGVSFGKMWKNRESSNSDKSKFFNNEDGYEGSWQSRKRYDDSSNHNLDDGFDEESYLNEFNQYNDQEQEQDQEQDQENATQVQEQKNTQEVQGNSQGEGRLSRRKSRIPLNKRKNADR